MKPTASTLRTTETGLWLCQRPIGPHLYPGSYPRGFLRHVLNKYAGNLPALHLCCGAENIPGFINVDITRRLKAGHQARPDVLGSMHRLPFQDATFAFTLWDPPYGRDAAQKMYNRRHLRIAQALQELIRVTKPSGLISVLYSVPLQKVPRSLTLHAIFAVTAGPQKHIRAYQVWQKGII